MPHRLDYRRPDADPTPPADPSPPAAADDGDGRSAGRALFWLTWVVLLLLLPPLFYYLLSGLRAGR